MAAFARMQLNPLVFDVSTEDGALMCGHCGAVVESIEMGISAKPRPWQQGEQSVLMDVTLDADRLVAVPCGDVYDMEAKAWRAKETDADGPAS